MEVLHPRCAGLDVHNDSVVACVRLAEGGHVKRHVETFATTTSDLERLSAWLAGHGVTHVAMEATGVYWKPVWAVLCEGDFALVLANAHHVKAVPGRKTDVNDDMAGRSHRPRAHQAELRATDGGAGLARTPQCWRTG